MMGMDLTQLNTPEECLAFAEECSRLAREARRKAVELRAVIHTQSTDVERELWKAVIAYEEILTKKNKRRTLASRTRQMIKRHGIIGTAERAVNRKIEAMGYRTLIELGYEDWTFESIILKYPESFHDSVVKLCADRLITINKAIS